MNDDFYERYKPFRKCNLPTRIWDKERRVYEYVYAYNDREKRSNIVVHDNVVRAFEEITYTGFCYTYHCKKNGDITEDIVGHFEDVIEALYECPESFVILKEDEQYYSKQELNFIRRVQKYLLFIGVKDYDFYEEPEEKYKNELQSKYENAYIYSLSSKQIKEILDKEQHYLAFYNCHGMTGHNKKYEPFEEQALITDEEDNFKLFVEFTYEDETLYKNIKDEYKITNRKDNDVLILKHFKILEKF